MRLVQVLVPEGKREGIVEALDDEGIDYAMWAETGRGDFEAVISFPVPTGGVEPVVGRLRDAGLEGDAYTIVQSTETVVSRRIDTLRERYTDLRISREELVARAADLGPETRTTIRGIIEAAMTSAQKSALAFVVGFVLLTLLAPSALPAARAVSAGTNQNRTGNTHAKGGNAVDDEN